MRDRFRSLHPGQLGVLWVAVLLSTLIISLFFVQAARTGRQQLALTLFVAMILLVAFALWATWEWFGGRASSR